MMFWGLFVFCIIWTGCFLWFYLERSEGKRSLLFKALSTCGPVLVAVAGVVQRGTSADWLLLVSALFFAAADVLLELHMLFGILTFLTGHLGVAIVIISRGCSYPAMGIVALLGVLTAFFVFQKKLNKFRALLPALAVYGAVLFGMAGAAVSGLWQPGIPGPVALLTAAGAVSFACSDMILGTSMVNEYSSRVTRWAVMVLYEAGVLLLVLAPFAAGL